MTKVKREKSFAVYCSSNCRVTFTVFASTVWNLKVQKKAIAELDENFHDSLKIYKKPQNLFSRLNFASFTVYEYNCVYACLCVCVHIQIA